ncbi:hypothetical protein ACIP6P_26580 [Streptomyces sp. NPDC088729]|uniref:hypothetical protein n=1 Tax=Streptomyces sp. NPDC088729 TaxID=3365876 RepID=UPI003829C1D8
MKHLRRASVSAVILTLTAFGLSACGSLRDDDCDETSTAVAQFAMAPELLNGTASLSSGSKPKPPRPPKLQKQGSKPKPPKFKKPQSSKPKSGKAQSGKAKGSKPKGSHHDDICDED